MSTVVMEQRKRIHPHKFTLWVAIGSLIMMFAGLTSAFIVKRNQAGFVSFEWPVLFWYSTIVMIASSATMYMSLQAFRLREMAKYRTLVSVTLVLGALFILLQFLGFRQLWNHGQTFNKEVSFSFLYTIVGIHAVHVLAGVIALIFTFANAFSKKVRSYNIVPVELMNTYWHFVDILWIYLVIFLLLIR